ncbi:hypothetical protein [uncultured Jatrophihabitans sp.]|uniref:hypothetical protein n=1 Tax=uncultured Jatrophihabitans sp. TaxID=1610747 RepID=UPI0035CC4BB4
MQFTMHFDPSPDVCAAARRCEADVFSAVYGNTEAQWLLEYGPYDPNSVFLAITEPGGEAAAMCRFILPGGPGLKTLDDLSRPPWEIDGTRSARAAGLRLEQTWDVATIAVRRKAAKPGLLAAALYHGLFQATTLNNVGWIVMMMDERARRLLSLLNVVTNVLPGAPAGPYLGSPKTFPLWANVAAMADRQRAVDPDAFRLLGEGSGLDGISVPPRSAFRLGGAVPEPAALPASAPA